MSSIGVVSLGCMKNLVDTERMLGLLRAAGHRFVSAPAEAEVLIVNTCGFIEAAKQESINTILELAAMKRTGRCRLLVATGCLTQRYREELSEALPEIDLMIGVREYDRLPALLADALGQPAPAPVCGAPRVLTTPPYRAFLRVGDGCSNRCAYCAIPLIRGPLQSEPIESLLDEAKRLSDGGVTELTVIAQDTSGYGTDRYGRPRLMELLRRLTEIDALHWVRVLYTYPDTVTPALIDEIRENEKLVNYLDMPLQHVNDAMLAAMHRRGSQAHIRRVLEHVERMAPDFILRTTMMVGFPGETDAQFEELLAFLRDHPFDRVGAFAFSPEEGTPAAGMPGQIPDEVKQARLDALMTQQRGISRRRGQRRVGQEAEVLIEGVDAHGAFGRSYAEAPDVDGRILLPGVNAVPGTYRLVRLTHARDYGMIGELL